MTSRDDYLFGSKITFDRYGHLMPGNEEEAAALLDGYLKSSAAR